MANPFKVVTREDAADNLSVSLSTLDSMIASGALPAPTAIPGSRRKYWHPDVFYARLEQLLLPPATPAAQREVEPPSQSGKSTKKASSQNHPAHGARARDAARLAKLNE
jgi:hypothetical protein